MSTLFLALGVALAGGVASVFRLGLARWNGYLPWGILYANTAASFIAGVEMVASDPNPVLIAGICGGLSTFSTFAAHSVEFFRNKQPLRGVFNIVANLVLPFTAALAPTALAAALLN